MKNSGFSTITVYTITFHFIAFYRNLWKQLEQVAAGKLWYRKGKRLAQPYATRIINHSTLKNNLY